MSGSKHTAGPQMLGYFYQARYALAVLFSLGKDSLENSISIEKFDDIAIEQNGQVTQLAQLKHHLGTEKSLGDNSVDLWKTLLIWIKDFNTRIQSTTNHTYSLITTSAASSDSAAFFLSPNENTRQIDTALGLLLAAAQSSTNDQTKLARNSFLALDTVQQLDFLSNIYILDSSPNITDTYDSILKELTYLTTPKRYDHFLERLEGWWHQKIILHLTGGSNSPITCSELHHKVISLREEFQHDSLPTDFFDHQLTPEEEASTDKNFVLQLKLITQNSKAIRYAIQDYYRASRQRARWIREDWVSPNDLVAYQRRLIEEWGRLFAFMEEGLEDDPSTEQLTQEGLKLYMQVSALNNETVFIKPKCRAPYVIRGTYHMLSDEFKVGWRADFENELKELIQRARENSA